MNQAIRYQARDFEKHKRVEVKLKGATGYTWKGGVVKEVSGRGLFVKLDVGNSNFFYFADVRPEAQPPVAPEPAKMPRPAPRPLATTIGEALAYTAIARVERPALAPLPMKPPIAVVPPPAPANAPQARPKRRIHAHHATAIGDVFRAYRLRERTTQCALAELLGVSNKRWSDIELGDTLPGDDLLRSFAELTGQPLNELFAMRDGKASEPSIDQPPPPLADPPPQESAAPLISAIEAVDPYAPSFEDFTDQLCELVMVPVDKDARRRWFALARELYAMAGK